MNIKKEFILRKVVGENILVPVGKTAIEFNGLITLNNIGVFIWQNLNNVECEEEMLNLILEKYDVDKATAEEDIKYFLQQLKGANIID